MLQQQKHSFSSKLFRALRATIISLNSENKSKDTKAVSSSSLKAEKLIIEEFKFRGNALEPPMGLSAIASHGFILYSIFVLVDSLCFAGAALLSSELWFHIDNSSILSLPIGPYPYAIASFAVIIVSLAHFLFYRLTLHEYVKKTLERWKPYNRLLVDTEAKYKQATSAGRSDT